MGGAMARAAAREKENELYLVNRHPEKGFRSAVMEAVIAAGRAV